MFRGVVVKQKFRDGFATMEYFHYYDVRCLRNSLTLFVQTVHDTVRRHSSSTIRMVAADIPDPPSAIKYLKKLKPAPEGAGLNFRRGLGDQFKSAAFPTHCLEEPLLIGLAWTPTITHVVEAEANYATSLL